MAKQYTVDPNDERLLDAKTAGDNILSDYEKSMQGAIDANTAARDEALGAIGVDKNGKVIEGSATDRLIDSQNKQTEFTIDTIEQQKEQARQDYTKEQSAAYVDWQKQSNAYGVNAEHQAAQGLQNSGYSESSKVAHYNQYQARITAARETFAQIKLEYDNAMTQARLQNDATLAQIILNAMKERLEIVTQFAIQNTDLLATLAREKTAIKQQNYANYMAVYNQILEENKYKTSVEEFNENMAEKASSGGGGGGGGNTIKKDTSRYSNRMKKELGIKNKPKKEEPSAVGPYEYLNALIASGESKDKVSNEISLALRRGEITKAEAAELRKTFTPRGLAY